MDRDRLQRHVRAHGLALEAAGTLCVASLRLRAVRKDRMVTVLGEPVPPPAADPEPAPLPPGSIHRGVRVGRMVERVARLLPWHPQCLPQALATQWMLRHRSVPAALHLGVADVTTMDAHAWVTVGPRTVVGTTVRPFAPVATFVDGVKPTAR